MLKNVVNGLILATLSILSGNALATDSTKYPAYDFKPQVVYKDIGLIATTGSQSDSRFPASHFEPRVLFQDKELIEKLGSKTASSSCRP
jgi:hypothetical protein